MVEDIGKRLRDYRDRLEKWKGVLGPEAFGLPNRDLTTACYTLGIARELLYDSFPEYFKKELEERD